MTTATASSAHKGTEYFIFNTTINNFQGNTQAPHSTKSHTRPPAPAKGPTRSFFQADFIHLLKLPQRPAGAHESARAQTVRKKPPSTARAPKTQQIVRKPRIKIRTQSIVQEPQNVPKTVQHRTTRMVPLGKNSSVTNLAVPPHIKDSGRSPSPLKFPYPSTSGGGETSSRSETQSKKHQSLTSSPAPAGNSPRAPVTSNPNTNTMGTTGKGNRKSFSMNGKRYSGLSGLGERYQRDMMNHVLTRNMCASKVHVVARIRPLNKVEIELKENGAGEEILKVLGDNTLVMEQDNVSFTLDGVEAEDSQSHFYDRVARDTIDDIFKGYNGTIFAYGPTGSGKTYTMLGPDIYSPEFMGIIPRASSQIFDHICSSEVEVEYEMKCGMLEIYRENLRDLLLPECSQSELKIKECPIRGIYVEGLSEQYIVNRDEFLAVVQKGEQARVVAETKLNRFSSRSHTLFILQITQKFSNGTVQTGRLNLVDLAGSEKLTRSGVHDERVEETKKINKSLSALGNVIHALTNGSDHVPYRDSKLTRILQESLGGNYKTTLIVTLSPFSVSKDETLSSIKFAQRARNVRNRVHINVKQSPENLYRIIEHLQSELTEARSQLQEIKLCMHKSSSASSADTADYIKLITTTFSEELAPNAQTVRNALATTSDQSSQAQSTSQLRGYATRVDTKTDEEHGAPVETKTETSRTIKGSSLIDVIAEKELSDLKAAQTTEEVTALQQKVEEYEKCIAECKDELRKVKKDRLRAEQRAKEYEDAKAIAEVQDVKKTTHDEHIKVQTEVLQQEVQSLTEALTDCENECRKLLGEKRAKFRGTACEEMQKMLTFKECKLEEYYNALFEGQESLCCSFAVCPDLKAMYTKLSVAGKQDVFVPLAEDAMSSKSPYAEELEQAMVEGKIPPETQIFLLKQQLVDAAIYNHSLMRALSTLEWKEYIEQNKARLKAGFCDLLESCNQSLDSVLDKTYQSHCRLRKRIEKFEAELYEMKEKADGTLPSIVLNTENSITGKQNPNISYPTNSKVKLVKTFTRRSLINNELSQIVPQDKKKPDYARLSYVPTETPTTLPEAIEVIREKDAEIQRLAQLLEERQGRDERILTDEAAMNSMDCDRLNDKVVFLKTELDLQVSRAEQLRKAYMNAREQLKALKELTGEVEQSAKLALKDENESWQRITSNLKVRL